jgi:hypothetical protein
MGIYKQVLSNISNRSRHQHANADIITASLSPAKHTIKLFTRYDVSPSE